MAINTFKKEFARYVEWNTNIEAEDIIYMMAGATETKNISRHQMNRFSSLLLGIPILVCITAVVIVQFLPVHIFLSSVLVVAVTIFAYRREQKVTRKWLRQILQKSKEDQERRASMNLYTKKILTRITPEMLDQIHS